MTTVYYIQCANCMHWYHPQCLNMHQRPRLQQKVGFIKLVDNCDADTLVSIIQHVVAPVSTIWSDEWVAYWQFNVLGYDHYMYVVNHSQQFKDPSPAHVQPVTYSLVADYGSRHTGKDQTDSVPALHKHHDW